MQWKCNLCSHETDGTSVPSSFHSAIWLKVLLVSTEYFSNLDANMLRLDHAERPELNRGTYEFKVPEEYWAQRPPPKLNPSYYSIIPPALGSKPPLPMNFIFAFDVSNDALETGFFKASCDLLKTMLYGGTTLDGQQTDSSFPPGCQFMILTYDRSLHFYDLNVRVSFLTFLACSDLSIL